MAFGKLALLVVLLVPLSAFAQDGELTPPPPPPEVDVDTSQAPSPPPPPEADAAPADRTDPPRAETPRRRRAMTPEQLDGAARADEGRPMRILGAGLGGLAGGAGGALLGGLIGFGVSCGLSNNGYLCGLGAILGVIPGGILGLGLGGWIGGNLAGGQAAWWAPMLGGLGGLVIGGLGTGLASGLAYSGGPIYGIVSFILGLVPVAGVIIGYELSHGAEVQKNAPQLAGIAPLLTSEQKGVALAWVF